MHAGLQCLYWRGFSLFCRLAKHGRVRGTCVMYYGKVVGLLVAYAEVRVGAFLRMNGSCGCVTRVYVIRWRRCVWT